MEGLIAITTLEKHCQFVPTRYRGLLVIRNKRHFVYFCPGKRVDSIQKQLHTTFEEAAWRQPSVILLDDLDQIAAAPTGPEQEISGEAVYFTRVAEGR